MPEFTADQKRAIEARGCNLLISAAAGSGKTAVLTERVLQLLIDEKNPVSVDSLLVVTFTNAAAAEMKTRISENISKKLSENISDFLRRHLNRQLALMGKASITTIHAFCLELIKNNFHLLDLDPAFRIDGDKESGLLLSASAEDMLEKMYSENPFFSSLCIYLTAGNDDRLAEEICKIYKFILSFPDYKDWLCRQVEEYNISDSIDNHPWLDVLKSAYFVRLSGYLDQYRFLAEDARNAGLNSFYDAYSTDIENIEHILSLTQGEWDILNRFVRDFKYTTARSGKDDDKETVKEFQDRREAIKKKFNAVLSIIATFDSASTVADMNKMHGLLSCLRDSILTLDEIYTRRKREKAIIDFNDFEHLSLSLLRDSENGLAKSLQKRYSHIFVDEYQDCNPTQEELFSYIVRRINGVPCNMFMVGDVKQSIYRFRHSDPSIFMKKSDTYSLCDEGITRKICLNKNFRSSRGIIEGINNVFTRTMSLYVGEVDYGDDEKLYYSEDKPAAISDEDKCELVIINPDDIDAASSIEAEARYVAQRITELHSEGVQYKDIVILLRGLKNRSPVFENEFKLKNIPYYTDGGSNYYENLEIRIFISLLRVCDNPMQDIPLAGLLRSPLFSFTEEDLLKIRSANSGAYYSALCDYSLGEDDLAASCRSFLQKLNNWRDMSISYTIDEFCEYILRETGLRSFALTLPGGDLRCKNLDLLVEEARGFRDSGFKDLFSFVTHIGKLTASEGGKSEAKTLSETSDVVRIMTIHKSKGLGFPVVFLCGTNGQFNTKDSEGVLLTHHQLGFGATGIDFNKKLKYPLLIKYALAEKIHIENISEEMRILYVALTRAKKKLICTAAVKDFEKLSKKYKPLSGLDIFPASYTSAAKSFLDWLYPSMGDKWILKTPQLAEAVVPEIPTAASVDGVSDFDPSSVLEYKYPHSNSSKLPTKFSVSELKRKYSFDDAASIKYYNLPLKERPSFMTDEVITPTQAGIINHLVLKELPIKDITEKDVEATTARLCDRQLLTEAETKAVNIKSICKFFTSPLGERLKKSDFVLREAAFNIQCKADSLFSDNSFGEDTVLVQGIIDLLFEEKGNLILVDFKTDKFLSEAAKASYETQLKIYGEAAEKIFKKPVTERYLYLLSQNKSVKI